MKPRKHNYKYTKLPRARPDGMPTSKNSVDIKVFSSLHSHSSLLSSSWAEGWPHKWEQTTKLMGLSDNNVPKLETFQENGL